MQRGQGEGTSHLQNGFPPLLGIKICRSAPGSRWSASLGRVLLVSDGDVPRPDDGKRPTTRRGIQRAHDKTCSPRGCNSRNGWPRKTMVRTPNVFG